MCNGSDTIGRGIGGLGWAHSHILSIPTPLFWWQHPIFLVGPPPPTHAVLMELGNKPHPYPDFQMAHEPSPTLTNSPPPGRHPRPPQRPSAKEADGQTWATAALPLAHGVGHVRCLMFWLPDILSGPQGGALTFTSAKGLAGGPSLPWPVRRGLKPRSSHCLTSLLRDGADSQVRLTPEQWRPGEVTRC